MLQKIIVKGLFSLFNYSIEFPDKSPALIITGPNGYGKTTLLKILYSLSTKNHFFFFQLTFDEISVEYGEKQFISIIRKSKEEITIDSNEKDSRRTLTKSQILENLNSYVKRLPFQQIGENRWVDRRTDVLFSTEDLILKFSAGLYQDTEQLNIFDTSYIMPDFGEVYLIREQRILRRISDLQPEKIYPKRSYRAVEKMSEDIYVETIEEYAQDLKSAIDLTSKRYSEATQILDSSYPQRLFNEKIAISEADFNTRFDSIMKKQKALTGYRLIESKQTHSTFSSENARALKIYLDDTEKKLEAFNDLLVKLDLFTSILNERRFAFKQIQIDKENGFTFLSDRGGTLSLKDLSSGEKQEVILLYEMLFKIKPSTLVLIDEPEISLHVVWQKEFLKDIMAIAELQKLKVIIATHSPQIINGNWDLTVDLEKIAEKI